MKILNQAPAGWEVFRALEGGGEGGRQRGGLRG